MVRSLLFLFLLLSISSLNAQVGLTSHEDSGLLSLHLLISDMRGKQAKYYQISNQQLNNRDLKND